MDWKVWYLYHSGFAVETRGHFLVFDYWRDTPKGGGLEQGVINPEKLADKDVIVFASHAHHDHFNPVILTWGKAVPRLRVVLSDDIRAGENVLRLGPGQTLEQPDLRVEALASNDQGVAFVVEVDGLTIYHGGDLNWWHWEGEPDSYNRGMESSYKREVDKLKGKAVDLAFVPVDPRLGKQYAWGADYFMGTVGADYLFPMHFGGEATVVGRLMEDAVSEPYRDRIVPLTKRGQVFCPGA